MASAIIVLLVFFIIGKIIKKIGDKKK